MNEDWGSEHMCGSEGTLEHEMIGTDDRATSTDHAQGRNRALRHGAPASWLLPLLAMLLHGCCHVPSQVVPLQGCVPAVRANRRAIHAVGVTGPDGTIHIEGTGFFINAEGHFVTGLHVLLGADKYAARKKGPKPGILLCLPTDRESRKRSFARLGLESLVLRNSELDVAVLKVKPNPFSDEAGGENVSYVRFDSAVPPDGEMLAFSGYPGQSKVLSTRQGVVACLTVREHCITKHGVPVLEIATRSAAGFSGSPTYRVSTGNVVGIVLGGCEVSEPGSAAVTDALPIGKLTSLLDSSSEGLAAWRATYSDHLPVSFRDKVCDKDGDVD